MAHVFGKVEESSVKYLYDVISMFGIEEPESGQKTPVQLWSHPSSLESAVLPNKAARSGLVKGASKLVSGAKSGLATMASTVTGGGGSSGDASHAADGRRSSIDDMPAAITPDSAQKKKSKDDKPAPEPAPSPPPEPGPSGTTKGAGKLDESAKKELESLSAMFEALPKFLYPDLATLKKVAGVPRDTYTFTLTTSSGARRFGYARRFRAGASASPSGKRYPMVLVILSSLPWDGLWRPILDILDRPARDGILAAEGSKPDSEVTKWLEGIRVCRPPKRGSSITVPLPDDLGGRTISWEFRRPDLIWEQLHGVNYTSLFDALHIHKLIALFGALVAERRIIITSSSLSRLSSAVRAALALLRPFTWHHIFIPILPASMVSFVAAPVPYLVGLHSSAVEVLDATGGVDDEVVVVDLDSNLVIMDHNDVIALPMPMRQNLIFALRRAEKILTKESRVDNPGLATAFYRFWAEIFYNYKALCTIDSATGTAVFNDGSFLSDALPSVSQFFEGFCTTQLFVEWVATRADPEFRPDAWDKEIAKYIKERTDRENAPSLLDRARAAGEKAKIKMGPIKARMAAKMTEFKKQMQAPPPKAKSSKNHKAARGKSVVYPGAVGGSGERDPDAAAVLQGAEDSSHRDDNGGGGGSSRAGSSSSSGGGGGSASRSSGGKKSSRGKSGKRKSRSGTLRQKMDSQRKLDVKWTSDLQKALETPPPAPPVPSDDLED